MLANGNDFANPFMTTYEGGDAGDWPIILLDVQISVTHARAMHLDETFTGQELIGLLDGIVFADF
jgi:hypothetical protein